MSQYIQSGLLLDFKANPVLQACMSPKSTVAMVQLDMDYTADID